MMHISQRTIGGRSVWLLLAEPNTDAPLQLSLAYDTSVSESRGGIENRRPLRAVPRVAFSYEFRAGEDDLASFRQFLGGLGDERVAVPLWFDSSATGFAPLLNAQVKVGYNPGFTDIVVAEGGSTPAGAILVPLVIGRLERPAHRYLLQEVADLQIAIKEDSPWTARLDIAASGTPSFTLAPNWESAPDEQTRDLIRSSEIGDGRELATEGDPAVVKWRQSAYFTLDRAQAQDFLGFFKSKRGSFGAFAMDSFFDVGADTPQAPLAFDGGDHGLMRFSDDVLKVSFPVAGLAEIRAGFEQVLAGEEEVAQFTRLFEIWNEADPADVAYLTSNEYPVTANGHTWTPARIEMGKFRSSLKLEQDTAEVTVQIDDLPQILPVIRYETNIPVKCRIHHADLSTDPATVTALTFGTAIKWRLKGKEARFSVEPFNGILTKNFPRFLFSRTCNFSLFDAGCARVSPAAMAKDLWQVTGTYWTDFSNWYVRIVGLAGVPAFLIANPSGFFDFGWVEIGTGLDKQLRVVTESYYHHTGDGWGDAYGATPVLHLKLNRRLRADLIAQGVPVTVYPGCDGSYGTCKNKFGNGNAFGGAPYAPPFILMKPSRPPQIDGGK